MDVKVENSNPTEQSIEKIENLSERKTSKNKIPSFSHCSELSFTIISKRKNFNIPFSIYRTSFDYIREDTSKAITTRRKNYGISNSSMFIGANQNLKAMNIHLSNHFRYNNTTHREITNFRSGKNRSADRVSINLWENNDKENNYKTENIKEKVIDVIKEINERWKSKQKISKNNFSFINKVKNKDKDKVKDKDKESTTINKKIYIQELLNDMNIKTISNNDNNSNKKNNDNNKEYYILIKHDKNNKNENVIYEIVSPSSTKDFEISINNFIYKKDNKENKNNNIETISTIDNSNLTNGKKKSKFSNKQIPKIKKSSKESSQKENEEFIPFFILTEKELKNLYQIIEKSKKNNKKEKKNYIIDNSANFNILNSIKYEKLRSIPKEKDQINNNKIQKDLDEINFNLFPIKVEKFELICSNKVRAHEIGKENIDVSNIALNQSFEIKQPKVGENEFDDILNKNKDMEDFGQTTPISLLQEKCFIYMVSKWVKYSLPQPQSRIYTKYSYKSGHPLFDPINLDITNFTLWIERIKTKNIYNNNKGYMGINSRTNYANKIKKTNSRGKNLSNKKKGYNNIYSNVSKNYLKSNK